MDVPLSFSKNFILPDVLEPNLKIVFCGTAASKKSAQVVAYYAGLGNRFWETLYHVGLTPYLMKPPEFKSLPLYGIGLTDVAKYASGNDSDLNSNDFDAASLRQKILYYAPKILAFTSKKAARAALELADQQPIGYGFQNEKIGLTQVYVLPSPSGAARRYWDIRWWQELATSIKEGKYV